MLVLGFYKSAKDGEKNEVSPKRGTRKDPLLISSDLALEALRNARTCRQPRQSPVLDLLTTHHVIEDDAKVVSLTSRWDSAVPSRPDPDRSERGLGTHKRSVR
jgi:hypothetical protein